MKHTALLRPLAVFVFLSLAAAQAQASFHLMQIEQIIGGVCGDVTAQAIQLRMRAGNQHLVGGARLVAHDAAGANPVLLITFPNDVAGNTAGSRILATSASFSGVNPTAADFTLTNLIPASYLAAGRLTFENPAGTIVYWSVSWGGASYTGSTTGSTTNDADGNFGPPFAGALPSSSDRALLFQGAFNALSTSNAADYAVTPAAATFTNNAGASGVVAGCLFGDGFESGNLSAWSATIQ